MKTVTKIQTFDGALHDSQRDAARHVEKIYGDLLTKLAHNLLRDTNGSYAATGDFIDNNLHRFEELAAVKRDLALTAEHEDA